MLKENIIEKAIDNSIRSLFQMIAVVSDLNDECVIMDHTKELRNISSEQSFRRLRQSLLQNIHPEDREAFSDFTEPSGKIYSNPDKITASFALSMDFNIIASVPNGCGIFFCFSPSLDCRIIALTLYKVSPS